MRIYAIASVSATRMMSDIIPDMTIAHDLNAYEPTLRDVLDVMNSGFERIEGRFEAVDTRLGNIETRLESVETNLVDVQQRVIKLEGKVDDIQEDLRALVSAEEKDAVATINHEERIVRLEGLNNIPSAPPTHLTDIES